MAREPKNNGKNVDVAALNEGLLLGLVRQHELTEAAEVLNAQLQAEIVARKKIEDALVNSEKLASVGRMAAVLAHEINNPLAAVTNVLYLAQSIEGLPESARRYLEMADGELKRIAHITRQTLGFYREASAPTTFAIASSRVCYRPPQREESDEASGHRATVRQNSASDCLPGRTPAGTFQSCDE
jgi:phosphoglycerate-specific signal transduction histidine kinase